MDFIISFSKNFIYNKIYYTIFIVVDKFSIFHYVLFWSDKTAKKLAKAII